MVGLTTYQCSSGIRQMNVLHCSQMIRFFIKHQERKKEDKKRLLIKVTYIEDMNTLNGNMRSLNDFHELELWWVSEI